jgi:AcrR family transcriptional regulator
VAASSGVAKTTISRGWRDKDELALAAVWNDLAGLPAAADIGDTRAELLTFVEPLATTLRTPLLSSVIRGLASEIVRNRALSSAYREQFIQPRRARLELVISRGMARGDLRPNTDARFVHELLVGPVFYRRLFSGAQVDDGLGSRVSDAALHAFAAQ